MPLDVRLFEPRGVLRTLGVLGALSAAAACGDLTPAGPRHLGPGHAAFSVAPVTSAIPAGGPTIVLAKVRGILIGAGGDSTIVVANFAGDSAMLTFDVSFPGNSADFKLDLTEYDGQSVAVYHGVEDITLKAGNNPAVQPPVLAYSAPDAGVQALHVNPTSLPLNAGGTGALSVTGTGANGQTISGIRVGWTSKDASVATVDANGAVQAGQFQGSTYVVARTATNVADSALVKVRAPVARVVVAPAAVTLARGQSGAVGAELRDAGNHLIDDRTATWTTSDPNVATVSASGVIQAIQIGMATVTATVEGQSASATVNVVSPVDHIEITPAALTFASIRETQSVAARLVPRSGASVAGLTPTFSSSNASVALVDASSGQVTATGNGTGTITATADGVTATAGVTVAQVATSITISPKASGVTSIGDTRTFTATAADALGTPVSASLITWTSSNAQVASVAGGVATGLAPGTATIAASANGKSDAATFTVVQVPRLIYVSSDQTQIQVGQAATLTAALADGNGNPIPGSIHATFATSTPNIASVTVDGHVTGLAPGTARFTATAGPATGAFTLTVIPNPNLGGTVAGQVINAATGQGIAGAVVAVASTSTSTGSASRRPIASPRLGAVRASFATTAQTVTTASDGSFTLTGVPTGSTLSITATGFVSTNDFSVQTTVATTMQLGALPLVPTSTLSATASGQVVSAVTGSGIAGAVITVRAGINALSGTPVLTVTADEGGTYHGTLPAGTYTVSAAAEGYVTANTTVPAVGGVTLANQNIVLSPTGLGSGSFRFVLTWGPSCYQLGCSFYGNEPPNAAPPDLDGHFVGPKGDGTNFEIAYYSKYY